ncbi:MAG: hypothetical protein OCC45_00615 [Desulfotalea sp.]
MSCKSFVASDVKVKQVASLLAQIQCWYSSVIISQDYTLDNKIQNMTEYAYEL